MVKTTDDVGGFVVRTSKRLCVCIVLAGVIYCVAEDSLYPYLFPITPLERSLPIRWTGLHPVCGVADLGLYRPGSDGQLLAARHRRAAFPLRS